MPGTAKVGLTGPDGTFAATVNVNGNTMTWLINGKALTFDKTGGAARPLGARAGGILPELIGKWCRMATRNNSAGVSGSSACFTLQADGPYQYAAESGSTGPGYGTASANSDAGTWTATSDTITSVSAQTGTRTFSLEKRNHPKTGDPMLLLDGEPFTTADQKAPWR